MLLDGLQLVTLADNGIESPDEPGTTFTENAVIKAIHAAPLSGLPAIADDWGLEVELLAGRPDILSARYSGPSHGDEPNYRWVLDQLRKVSLDRRRASFRSVLAFIDSDGTIITDQVESQGPIVEPIGSNGFACDPSFELNDGRTMAELDPAKKDAISHRSRTRPNPTTGFELRLVIGDDGICR